MALKKKNNIVDKSKPDCIYQTIASLNNDYKTYKVINEYQTLSEAEFNYENDMKNWKEEHDSYHNFGIKEINKNNLTN